MRLLPRTMAGQLLASLLLAVVVAHLAGIALRQAASNERLHPLASRYILDRMAGVYQAVSFAVPGQEGRMLEAIGAGRARFRLDTAAGGAGPGMNDAEQALARELAQRFDPGRAPRIRVRITGSGSSEGSAGADAKAESGEAGAGPGIQASMELKDGRWLVGFLQTPGDSPWWRPLHFSIPVSTIPVLLVALPFIRRILRPIRALEKASERISRGEHGEPLPVEGPREARELTAAFNLMAERQKRFVGDRTRMLAAISHDLRTPITSLRLRVEMLDDPAQRAAMVRTLDTMRQMVEETLRFAAADSIDETACEADLAAIAREVATDASRPGAAVHYEGPARLPCRCRPLGIRRALANLVDNAARHGSTVAIRGRIDGDGIAIEVCDNGPGIAPALLEHVFEPFTRLEPARNVESGGVGLGLAIARSCVEAHGGSLRLANRPEGGLAAIVRLPRPAAMPA